MKYIKKACWVLLAFIIVFQIGILVTVLLHPVGGGEYHEIFAYSSIGRLDVALWVYAEYVITGCALCFLLIFFRYPLSWVSLSIITFFIAWFRWWGICYFPYQSIEFHKVCKLLLYAIFPIIILNGFVARWLSDRFFQWRRKRNFFIRK